MEFGARRGESERVTAERQVVNALVRVRTVNTDPVESSGEVARRSMSRLRGEEEVLGVQLSPGALGDPGLERNGACQLLRLRRGGDELSPVSGEGGGEQVPIVEACAVGEDAGDGAVGEQVEQLLVASVLVGDDEIDADPVRARPSAQGLHPLVELLRGRDTHVGGRLRGPRGLGFWVR